MKTLLERVIAIARGEIGVRESGGSNRGPRVDEYQRADTLPGVGYAWCASFLSWCFKQAGEGTKPLVWSDSASCDVILAWARSQDLLFESPKVGDVFLVMASKYDATHTGLVVDVDGASFTCVEGNTNLSGGREGFAVLLRKRSNADRYKFVRWIDAQPAPADVPALSYRVQVAREDAGKSQVTLQTPNVGGLAMVPVRAFGEALGRVVHWNDEDQQVLFNGRVVPAQVIQINDVGHVPLRALALWCGYELHFRDTHDIVLMPKRGGAG